MYKQKFYFLLVSTSLMLSTFVEAIEIKTSGFFTTGVTRTDNTVKYDYQVNDQLNFLYDTKVGLNFRSQITKDISVATQFLAKNYPEDKRFGADVDWAYATYKVTDKMDINIGKQKFPVWLMSSYLDVGMLYPWIRVPNELYNISPVRVFTGANVEYRFDLGDIRLTTGLSHGRSPFSKLFGTGTSGTLAVTTINDGESSFDNLYLDLQGDTFQLRVSWARLYDFDAYAKKDMRETASGPTLGNISHKNVRFPNDRQYEFATVGGKYNFGSICLMGEYVKANTTDNDKFTNGYGEDVAEKTAKYLTLGYHFKKYGAHIAYADFEFDMKYNRIAGGTPATQAFITEQKSMIIGGVVATSDSSNIKAEVQHIKVSGSSKTGLFETAPAKDDTVHMFSLAFNFIF